MTPPSGDWIRLEDFLKLVGATTTGGEAKRMVQAGDVRVNGAVEIRRGRKLKTGDRVEVSGGAVFEVPVLAGGP